MITIGAKPVPGEAPGRCSYGDRVARWGDPQPHPQPVPRFFQCLERTAKITMPVEELTARHCIY